MAVVSLAFNSLLSSAISLFKPALSPFFCIVFIPNLKEIQKTVQMSQDRTNPGRSRQSNTHESFVDVSADIVDDVRIGAVSNDGV